MATKNSKIRTIFLMLLMVGGNMFLLSKPKKITQTENKILLEIQSIQEIIKENNVQATSCENELALLNLKISASEEILRLLNLAGEEKESYIASLKNEVFAINSEIEKTRTGYINLLIQYKQNLSPENKLLFLFGSKNTNQFLTRVWYLDELKRHKYSYIKKLINKKADVKKNLLLYSTATNERLELTKKQTKEIANLQKLQSEQLRTKKLISSENSMLIQKIKTRKKELQELNKIVSREISNDAQLKKTKPKNKKLKIQWPLRKGLIVSKFGKQNHPDFHGIHIQNNGVDILTNGSESVTCALNGEVSAVVDIADMNTTVIIKSGNYRLVYSNLSDVKLSSGDIIKTGTEIGKVALDSEDKYTLHFEIWEHSDKLNPELFK